MTSSALLCEVCIVHLKWIKGESGFRVKFIKVDEWFNWRDKLKIIFKSKKNKMTKLSFF